LTTTNELSFFPPFWMKARKTPFLTTVVPPFSTVVFCYVFFTTLSKFLMQNVTPHLSEATNA
ncbi:hypothetical protein, partial [Paenilisteria newyorkensis]|uniref:hypothetical protein n=1 Tax=Listeria newyorkensis TaxID=1497681 RepID=UPI001C90F4D3